MIRLSVHIPGGYYGCQTFDPQILSGTKKEKNSKVL